MRIILILIAIGLLVSCKESTDNEKKVEYGKLEGTITNGYGQPLNDVSVTIGTLTAKTNTIGYYTFNQVEVGDVTVNVTREAYLNQSGTVEIRKEETAVLDFVLSAGNSYLAISDSVLALNSKGGTFTLRITSNADWQVHFRANWLKQPIAQGGGDAALTFEYPENTSGKEQLDTIRFVSGELKKQLIVRQGIPLKLLKAYGLPGNDKQSILPVVRFEFNKPVIIESVISPPTPICATTLAPRQSNNMEDIFFDFACGELGGDYKFNVTVKDKEGGRLSETVNISLYSHKKMFNELISDFLLINHDTEALICAYKPNSSKIYRYSIARDSVLETYDLSGIVSPIRMAYNPHNEKIYIIGADPSIVFEMGVLDPTYLTPNLHSLFTLDMKTGRVRKEYTFTPEPVNNPQPFIIPYQIAFTRSGAGVALFIDEIVNGITARAFDSIPQNGTGQKVKMMIYTEYISATANFDYSKIYMVQPSGVEYFGIFNGHPAELKSFVPRIETRSNELVANRKTDMIYFRNLYDQFIGNTSGYQSKSSYLDSRHLGRSDFSYRPGEENIVYCCEAQSFIGYPNKFTMLDYNSGTTLLKTDVVEGLHRFTTTTDGKWALVFKWENNFRSGIYVFDTEMFYRK